MFEVLRLPLLSGKFSLSLHEVLACFQLLNSLLEKLDLYSDLVVHEVGVDGL